MVTDVVPRPSTLPVPSLPDARGRFGQFGGQYAPETLMPALEELEEAYYAARSDPAYQAEIDWLAKHYVGRPTPLYFAANLTREVGGARIFLKREDLAHTGAHKINNAIGQALLAKRMGKRRIIAETGAGQHGVASATVCALLGLDCIVYMGEVDIARQSLNVFRMKLLGAEVRSVSSGSKTLKDAINEAIRDWVTNVRSTFYLFGTAAGMHPYPMIVRDLQAVIGREARTQMLEQTGRLPDVVIACVGGGSNAIGMFHPFVGDEGVEIDRGRGGRARDREREARGDPQRGQDRRTARFAVVCLARSERTGDRDALDLGRTRLPRCRTGALLVEGRGAGDLRQHHRRGGAGRVPDALPDRGDHPGVGIESRDRLRRQIGGRAAAGRDGPDQSLRAR